MQTRTEAAGRPFSGREWHLPGPCVGVWGWRRRGAGGRGRVAVSRARWTIGRAPPSVPLGAAGQAGEGRRRGVRGARGAGGRGPGHPRDSRYCKPAHTLILPAYAPTHRREEQPRLFHTSRRLLQESYRRALQDGVVRIRECIACPLYRNHGGLSPEGVVRIRPRTTSSIRGRCTGYSQVYGVFARRCSGYSWTTAGGQGCPR